MGSVTTLEREMFSEAEAARLLRLAQSTLHYWLEGGTRRGKTYKPVIRTDATGSKSVTWGEFVEAGLLRQYRRVHQVPLVELRNFIEGVRQSLGVTYPLAHEQPFIGTGRRLLVASQEAAGLPADFALVVPYDGQLVLTPAADSFVHRVEWDSNEAVAWRPHAEEESPVRMDVNVRFGLPAVGGVRTEVIWEHVEAGEAFDEVASEFDLSPADVRWAYAFEASHRSAA